MLHGWKNVWPVSNTRDEALRILARKYCFAPVECKTCGHYDYCHRKPGHEGEHGACEDE
jgi:hypothetical protein